MSHFLHQIPSSPIQSHRICCVYLYILLVMLCVLRVCNICPVYSVSAVGPSHLCIHQLCETIVPVRMSAILRFTINNSCYQGYFPGFKVVFYSCDQYQTVMMDRILQPSFSAESSSISKFFVENILNEDRADGNTGFDFT